jgi:DNA-binding protein H-NS
MDLSALSVAELNKLLSDIPKEISRREKGEKARIRKELEVLAVAHGYTLEELLGDTGATAKRVSKPAAAKYRHPEDSALTWSGRGRKPRWVVEFLAKGGKIESLAI